MKVSDMKNKYRYDEQSESSGKGGLKRCATKFLQGGIPETRQGRGLTTPKRDQSLLVRPRRFTPDDLANQVLN